MAEDTFTCDRCGRELPKRQMKELADARGGSSEWKQLCPECLDEVMNKTDEPVVGIEGEEKRRAAKVGEGDAGKEEFGERP